MAEQLVDIGAWRHWFDGPGGRRSIRAWSATRPGLQHWDREDLAAPRGCARTDRMQADLVGLAQGGDGAAAWTLLVQLQPGLLRLVRTTSTVGGRSWPDAADEVRSVFFETVCRHPLKRRQTQIAANLLLDTRQRLDRGPLRARSAESPTSDRTLISAVDRVAGSTPDPVAPLAIGLELEHALRRLPGSPSSRRLTATLAIRAWVLDEPRDLIAEDLGLPPTTITKRLQRLRAMLRTEAMMSRPGGQVVAGPALG